MLHADFSTLFVVGIASAPCVFMCPVISALPAVESFVFCIFAPTPVGWNVTLCGSCFTSHVLFSLYLFFWVALAGLELNLVVLPHVRSLKTV